MPCSTSATHARPSSKPHQTGATLRALASRSSAQATQWRCCAHSASRRRLLQGGVALTALTCGPHDSAEAARSEGDWSTPGLASGDTGLPEFYKLPNGVKVQTLVLGNGPTSECGDRVTFDYVLRRSNGYFIYGTMEGVSFQPRDVPTGPVSFVLGQGSMVEGLDAVLTGLPAGTKIRALVPPAAGYVDAQMEPQPPTYAAKRQVANHNREPLLFELQLLKVAKAAKRT